MLLHICIFLGGIFSRFQLCLLNMGGVYTPSDSHDHSYHGTHNRTSNHIGARSIVRSPSLVPLVLSFNSCFHCTTVAYRRKIYRKIQCIYIAQRSLWIVRVSYEYFFICDYFGNSLRTISIFFGRTTVYCFCSSVNCEMGLNYCFIFYFCRRIVFFVIIKSEWVIMD